MKGNKGRPSIAEHRKCGWRECEVLIKTGRGYKAQWKDGELVEELDFCSSDHAEYFTESISGRW